MSGSSCTADRKFSSGQPTGSGTTFSYNVTAAGVFLGELLLFFSSLNPLSILLDLLHHPSETHTYI